MKNLIKALVRLVRRDTRTPLQKHGAALLRGERAARLVFADDGGNRT